MEINVFVTEELIDKALFEGNPRHYLLDNPVSYALKEAMPNYDPELKYKGGANNSDIYISTNVADIDIPDLQDELNTFKKVRYMDAFSFTIEIPDEEEDIYDNYNYPS